MLAARIRKARLLLRLSQADLAALIGISRSAVANWEGGSKGPSGTHLGQLSLALGVSYEWLATGRGSPALQGDWTPALDAEVVDDPDELKLLSAFRASRLAAKRAILAFVASTSLEAGRIVAKRQSAKAAKR